MAETPLKILILGASYGLLPGVKLALAGHEITFVGRAEELAMMEKSTLNVRIPLRRTGELAELRSSAPVLVIPDAAKPELADIVLLAMQEPHFADPAVAALMQRIAASQKPCLSIMNLPPPPFLARLGIGGAALDGVYASSDAWEGFDPARLSNASPDPQALRMDAQTPGELTVTLASNFKAAPFAHAADQQVLERMARDMSRLKVDVGGKSVAPPVRLLAHSSPFIPLAKWPMLIAGNCRCLTEGGICTIAEAVLGDEQQARAIYDQVTSLITALGAQQAILVPFGEYAKAARQLTRPSSAARAIAGGAARVERIDRLVLNLMREQQMDCEDIQQVSALMESRLSANR